MPLLLGLTAKLGLSALFYQRPQCLITTLSWITLKPITYNACGTDTRITPLGFSHLTLSVRKADSI